MPKKKKKNPWCQILLKYLIDFVRCNVNNNKMAICVTLNKKKKNTKRKKERKLWLPVANLGWSVSHLLPNKMITSITTNQKI
jgi:hypothetical protein